MTESKVSIKYLSLPFALLLAATAEAQVAQSRIVGSATDTQGGRSRM